MSRIDIHARHELSREDAQNAADELARDLATKFDIDYGWDGDTLVFERPGVDGEITVDDESIHVQARLGLLLALLKGRIEEEIHDYLRSHFNCRFTP
ncbi:polyhydroxyalkanoic acid system family protein [Elongatibacter sediminis]|uniref:Polyhydroxyalkanoic acid system family protein n=1 Tax=Elongatibacter sediminis TaxID=3119006 RepID=A0AAW9RFG6_9GAMM